MGKSRVKKKKGRKEAEKNRVGEKEEERNKEKNWKETEREREREPFRPFSSPPLSPTGNRQESPLFSCLTFGQSPFRSPSPGQNRRHRGLVAKVRRTWRDSFNGGDDNGASLSMGRNSHKAQPRNGLSFSLNPISPCIVATIANNQRCSREMRRASIDAATQRERKRGGRGRERKSCTERGAYLWE